MAATKKKAVARRNKSTKIANMKQQIADEAAGIGDSLGASSGIKIRITQAKEFLMPDGTKSRDPIRCVIVDFNSQNHYYEGAYDPENPAPPACFALSKPASLKGSITNMQPATSVPDKMHDDCTTCPMNQFGTDNRGRGKACKNIRRLVVLEEGAEETAALLLLDVSPSALQGYDGYVKKLAVKHLTPITVVTEVDFNSASDFPVLTFQEVAPNGMLESHWLRRPEAQIMLAQEPDLTPRTEAKPKGKVTKKKTSRRRAA